MAGDTKRVQVRCRRLGFGVSRLSNSLSNTPQTPTDTRKTAERDRKSEAGLLELFAVLPVPVPPVPLPPISVSPAPRVARVRPVPSVPAPSLLAEQLGCCCKFLRMLRNPVAGARAALRARGIPPARRPKQSPTCVKNQPGAWNPRAGGSALPADGPPSLRAVFLPSVLPPPSSVSLPPPPTTGC